VAVSIFSIVRTLAARIALERGKIRESLAEARIHIPSLLAPVEDIGWILRR
jgi:hypothetical protein